MQAERLEQIYTIAFAHPAVNGIYLWGFWRSAHWWPDAALWDEDWQPQLAAHTYQSLRQRWQTRRRQHTNAQGELQLKAFHGSYAVRIKTGAGWVMRSRHLTPGNTVTHWNIVLPAARSGISQIRP